MNKHHFIVSLALVSVLMVGSLGLASCVPRGKDYNSSISNTTAILNPDEVAKLDAYGLANLIEEVRARFSRDEKDEFFRSLIYNSARSNVTNRLSTPDGLADFVIAELNNFSEEEIEEFNRSGGRRALVGFGSFGISKSTPDGLADFVIAELNNFSKEELKAFFTAELHDFSADLIQMRTEVWEGEEKAAPVITPAPAPPEKEKEREPQPSK